MGLVDTQDLMARLSTDAAYRRVCLADPALVAVPLGLDTESAAQLLAEIDRFARSLVQKRRRQVEKLLPLTHRQLGPERFTALFRDFARTSVPAGIQKHRLDATRFAKVLAQPGSGEPSWVRELVRYEAASLEASDPSRRFLIRGFRHTLSDLSRAALEGDIPPPARPCLALWLRVSPGGRLRHFVVALPAARRQTPVRPANETRSASTG